MVSCKADLEASLVRPQALRLSFPAKRGLRVPRNPRGAIFIRGDTLVDVGGAISGAGQWAWWLRTRHSMGSTGGKR